MFLPKGQSEVDAEKWAETARKEAFARIEAQGMELIPVQIRQGVQISVQEVQCGDPDCAPIDTSVTILFPSGGRGMLGLPMEAREVEEVMLQEVFPTVEVLEAWYRGEEAEWPPYEEEMYDDETQRPTLRFKLDDKVECRTGPDPITGWAKGTVIQLWYHEPSWPANSWAPYKIGLDDGRNIFAPADVDQVIRKQQ